MTGSSEVVLLGHRGTSTQAPENTAPAFQFAIDHHADILEIDVRLSRDNHVLVIHDETLDRTTNGSGPVRQAVLTDLKKLDAAYRFQPFAGTNLFKGQGTSLLTLSELFTQFPEIGVNIDIKDNDNHAVDAVVRDIDDCEATARCVVASFHDGVLCYCRERYPHIETSAGMSDVKRFYWWYLTGQRGAAPLACRLFQLPTQYYGLSLSSQRFIRAIHTAEGAINYWTINKPNHMRRLLQRGADGIVTDRADLASAVFKRHREGRAG